MVWLNEAQRYFREPGTDAGRQVATALRTLLARARDGAGPLLVLATLWKEHWGALTSPAEGSEDPYAQQRELLLGTGLHTVVPGRFTDDELKALHTAAVGDPQLRLAVEQTQGSGEIAQFLAGSLYLLDRYENAPPGAKALLHAAMDYRRLGHSELLKLDLLVDAAPGYLTDREWDELPNDWPAEALAYCTKRRHGVRPPLYRVRPRPRAGSSPGAPDLFRLTDYLEQFGRAERRSLCPPAAFWESAARHARPPDLEPLAQAAKVRGRLGYAFVFARLTTSDTEGAAGSYPGALQFQADLLQRAGHEDEALELLDDLATAGHPSGLLHLAQELSMFGDWDDQGGVQLTRPYWEDAVRLTVKVAEQGHSAAYGDLVQLYEEVGDDDLAQVWEQRLLDAEDGAAMLSVASTTKDRERRIRMARRAMALGEACAAMPLIDMYEGEGDHVRAEEVADHAPRTADFDARLYLAWEVRGEDPARAERLVRPVAAEGLPEAMQTLSWVLKDTGDLAGAQEWADRAVAVAQTGALRILAILREDAGDHDGAERWAVQAAEADDPTMLATLAERRYRSGDHDGVARLLRSITEGKRARLLTHLARRRAQARDFGGAQDFLGQAIVLGDNEAHLVLARMLGDAGDAAAAQGHARRALDSGLPGALDYLIRLRHQAGDHTGAERLEQFGVTADGHDATTLLPFED
ncbi:hypothetical protein ACU686_12005 [Yinghuangia aomiensis]